MKAYFIGIGGIGMSALAQYYLDKNYSVVGSDLTDSEITKLLRDKGAEILVGKQKASNVPDDVGIVIYTPAIQPNNPELKKARKLKEKNKKIKILSYPQALGKLTKNHYTIAIAGTHGKSTTTALVALILIKAGLDPTVIIGTKIREFGNSNYRLGKSKYLVIEACEHQASFLNYWPKIEIITNIEPEHLDYYKTVKNLLAGFKKFILHLKKADNNYLVANKEDKNLKKLVGLKLLDGIKVRYFSVNQPEAEQIRKIIKIPGEHNVYNSLAAVTAAKVLKIPLRISYLAISNYKGAWRRFEIGKYQVNNQTSIKIVNDYAHHPTEVLATLKAGRQKFKKEKIWCIFQPHQYQRTFYLFDDFVKTFKSVIEEKIADKIIITDIFDVAGRENKTIKKKINAQKLVKSIGMPDKIEYIPKDSLLKFIAKKMKPDDVLIVMGAGDIYQLFKNSRLT